MEVACPQCQQQLRVPDDVGRARVRCRSCQHIFRPADLPSLQVPEFVTPVVVEEASLTNSPAQATDDESLNQFLTASASEPPPPRPKKSSGWGIGILVLLFLLGKGPKLWKLLNPGRQQQPAPVQLDDETRRAIRQKMLEQQVQRQRQKENRERENHESNP